MLVAKNIVRDFAPGVNLGVVDVVKINSETEEGRENEADHNHDAEGYGKAHSTILATGESLDKRRQRTGRKAKASEARPRAPGALRVGFGVCRIVVSKQRRPFIVVC